METREEKYKKKKGIWSFFDSFFDVILKILLYGLAGLYGFLLITFAIFYFYDFKSDEVIVAVLDTGIDSNHSIFKNRLVEKGEYDTNGHGTHVAGIVASSTEKTKILPVRIFQKNEERGSAFFPIIYSIYKGANVINMSFTENENFLTKSAVWLAQRKGTIIVASSGNDGEKMVNFPAKYPGVISVGSIGKYKHTISSFSNYSEDVSFFANGEFIKSSLPGGKMGDLSGTSMATAEVSGAIAFLKEKHPSWSNEKILHELERLSITVSNEKEPVPSYRVVDTNRISSVFGNKKDIWIQSPPDYVKEDKQNFVISTYQAKSVSMFQDDKLIHKQGENSSQKIAVQLHKGNNHFRIEENGTNHIYSFRIILDQENPEVSVQDVKINNETFINIKANDACLSRVEINGKETPFSKNPIDLFVPYKNNVELYHIVITDCANNKIEYQKKPNE